MSIKKRIKWWGDKREWGVICGTKEAEIASVKIFDGKARLATKFEVGDKITVKAGFDVHEEVKGPHFGVAIFRDDGVYCYGPNTLFDGYKIEKLIKGKGWFSINYEKMLLMPGKYWLSVGIWDKKEVLPYSFHIGYYSFRITGTNKNKQLSFLSHKWNGNKLVDSIIGKELIPIDLNFLEKKWKQKFKTPQREKSNTFFNLSGQWQNKISSTDIEISSIELLDSSDNLKSIFNTGEDLKIKLEFKFLREPQDYYLWLGLFRGDDVYCHSASKKLSEEVVALIYPNFPLLHGDYYLSAGIWKKNQREPLLYKHRASLFKMLFLGEDHGTVYLEHNWHWQLP